MMSRLSLSDGLSVLEPACGDGAFVEALHSTGFRMTIWCLDKDPAALDRLHERFGQTVRVHRADTILSPLKGGSGLLARNGFPERFDRIVGNPPYGGWLDYETRAALKKAFPNFHVRETYALFILRCFELLNNGGVLSFIVPDTFLTVGAHRPLREILLKSSELMEVITLPSKLFPGVAFGYSGLCIITLRKPFARPDSKHKFRLISVHLAEELTALAGGVDAGISVTVLQRQILQRPDMRIWASAEPEIESVLHAAKLRLGDVAECKTGIYTGDNRRFIRSIAGSPVRGEYYSSLPASDVCDRSLSEGEKARGISALEAWIPIVKGGSHRFVQKTSWVLDWSVSAIAFYRSDTKARFQNSDFYFREGLGVPMVTSTRINAFLIEQRVFDQSVVGIFPKRQEWLWPLLVILNCSFATKLLKEGINPTANNSANYLKKIPLPNLTHEELRHLGAIGRLIARKRRAGLNTDAEEQAANEQVAELYQRGNLPTMQGTWLDAHSSDGNTPLFPCLRERPHPYESKRRGRSRSAP
jgi:hypothetical protein